MLDALEADELLIGAYTDRRGRACPMLAAHRRGAKTDVGDFPRAWDAFGRARRPRAATQRELEVLRALLEEAIGCEPARLEPEPRRSEPVRHGRVERVPARV